MDEKGWRASRSRGLSTKIKQPVIPGPGWKNIIKQFKLHSGDVLLIQHAQDNPPPREVLEGLAEDLGSKGIDATLLVLPGDLNVQKVSKEQIDELLEVLIDLAERALEYSAPN